MANYDAPTIVNLIKSGQGPAGLFEFGGMSGDMATRHQESAQKMATLQNAMSASWKGDASQQAYAGAGPLMQASDVSANHLTQARELYTGQGQSFSDLKNSLPDEMPGRPESTFASDNLPFLTSRNEEIDAYNAQAQQVVDRYNGYNAQSTHNASNWPADYGQLGLPPGGVDFAVKQPDAGPGINPGEAPTVNGPGGLGTSPSAVGHTGGTGGTGSAIPGVNGPGGGSPYSPGTTSPSGGTPIPAPHSTFPSDTGPSGRHPNANPNTNPNVLSYLPQDGRPQGGRLPTSAAPPSGNGDGRGTSAGQRVGGGGVNGGPGSGPRAGGIGSAPGAPGSGANAGLGAGKGTGAGFPGQQGMGPGAAAGPGSGRGGGAGMGGMGGGAGRGQREEDTEHKRLEVLQEPDPDAIFGPDRDQRTTPPVIGG